MKSFICFKKLICALLLLGIFLVVPDEVRAERDRLGWTRNEDILLFHEALVKIRKYSLTPESHRTIVQQAIRAYLRQKDPYSDYLPPEEYTAYKKAGARSYCGVGMEILLDRTDRIVCVPFPGGPAYRAGVRYGDILERVDGRRVSGESIFKVGARIRGPAGSAVELAVKNASGGVERVNPVRETVRFKTVLLLDANPLPVIKIFRFTRRTVEELKALLSKTGLSRAKIIDFRGNTGGDLHAAIEAASLFLKPGEKVVDLKSRSETREFIVKKWPLDRNSRVFIWQDKYTASAAEVFIAALTRNGRAVSVGETSLGKGLAQKVVELTDGSALFITHAVLIPPDGSTFQGKGLAPTHRIRPDPSHPEKAYSRKVRMLMQDQGR